MKHILTVACLAVAGILVAPPPAKAADFIYSCYGVLLDNSGHGIPDAGVAVHFQGENGSGVDIWRDLLTNADGEYSTFIDLGSYGPILTVHVYLYDDRYRAQFTPDPQVINPNKTAFFIGGESLVAVPILPPPH